MIEDIKLYGSFDSHFQHGIDKTAKKYKNDYLGWLRSLDDRNLLATYNRMRDLINRLD